MPEAEGTRSDAPPRISIEFDAPLGIGRLRRTAPDAPEAWNQLCQAAIVAEPTARIADTLVELPWPALLSVLRTYGVGATQRRLGYVLVPLGEARERIQAFARDLGSIQRARTNEQQRAGAAGPADLQTALEQKGFRRKLKPYQQRDLARLMALSNGANFSVPGAGKTTVSLALNLLIRQPGSQLIVVCPVNAFSAWRGVVAECMDPAAPDGLAEPFTIAHDDESLARAMQTGARRIALTYERAVRAEHRLAQLMLSRPTHLILDESHKIKSYASLRGSLQLRLSPLPIRRDILSGTPMPQSAEDLESQLDFLWPGAGLSGRIASGESPRAVIGSLYVRTTKLDLGLPPVQRHFVHTPMNPGQLALYTVIRDAVRRQISQFRSERRIDLARASRSVLRLLQISTNPSLAAANLLEDVPEAQAPAIMRQALDEGPSPKMLEAASLVRRLSEQGRKAIVWTIFTDTVTQMEARLADLNPVVIRGGVPSGDPDDPETREGRIRRIHEDESCRVMIANPAAASEGMSLHTVVHDAIYLDRSYNATHYLQSLDRVHRLGLPDGVETNIYILQSLSAPELGSIDHSVSRRLANKLRGLQQLLDDQDLHQVALDEENAVEPVNPDITAEDLDDLIAEIEGRVPWDESQAA